MFPQRLLLLCAIALCFTSCFPNFQVGKLRRSNRQIVKHYKGEKHQPAIGSFTANNGTTIRTIAFGDSTRNKVVVLLHGSPASMNIWDVFFTDTSLVNHCYVAACDRVGYGYSNYGNYPFSLDVQAAPVVEWLQTKFAGKQIYIVGSSYGGTLAAKVAMLMGNKLSGLMLVSASTLPKYEKTYKATYLSTHWYSRWMVPSAIRIASKEKLAHTQILEGLNGWDSINCKVCILHGSDDGLVYVQNAYYTETKLLHLKPTLYFFPGRKHNLLWQERPALIKIIKELTE
jgi:pimeloyl-ACP methyl ester carboxylesterase